MELMEGVMVVDVLERSFKKLISGWRSCGVWGNDYFNPLRCSCDLRGMIVNMLTCS